MKILNWLSSILEYVHQPPKVRIANGNNEILEEIGFHLNCSAEDKIDAGLEPNKAKEIALNRFGDVDAIVKECKEVSSIRYTLIHRAHQFATILFLFSTVALSVLFFQNQRTTLIQPVATKNAISPTGYSVAATSGDIVGTVEGECGPIASANILAVVKAWPPNGYRQQSYMTTTGPDGSFEIKDVYAPDFEYEVQVAAIAEGHSLKSEYMNLTKGTLNPFKFRLKQGAPFELRFESGDGQPVEGVCTFPFERVERDGKKHSVYFSSADPIVQKSNPAGNVSMPHFFPGERATVLSDSPTASGKLANWSFQKTMKS